METPLRQWRTQRRLTLTEVASAVGIDTGNLSRIELGKQKASTALAAKLAERFKGQITEMQILYPKRYVQPAAPAKKSNKDWSNPAMAPVREVAPLLNHVLES